MASQEFEGQAVTVMGLGGFGGGLAVVEFLLNCGAHVTVSDRRTAEELADSLRRLPPADAGRLTLHLGEHRESDFRNADLLVVNPAVRPDHPLVAQARRRGVAVASEMNLFWERCPARIAGVTGTNGKSTTTKLLHHLLTADGRRAWLGGNIGGSLLSELDRISPDDWVVLELSSFQLHALQDLRASPEVAVVTNFAPNHLDWHGSIATYRDAKQTILRWQHSADVAVLNANNEVSHWKACGRTVGFRPDDIVELAHAAANPAFTSPHQLENCAAAVCAAREIGVRESTLPQGLAAFVGLPHRIQFLGTIDDRRWYDDSASTTPESTLAALASFPEPVVLLVGGADKGVDLSPLAAGIVRSARAAILLGDVAAGLRELILTASSQHSRTGFSPLTCVTIAASLSQAVAIAHEQSAPGDVVLLSPGCASYGWFANFVERGEAFGRLVRTRAV